MSPSAVPSRITIDFRDAALPSRTWILGVDEAATGRMELIAFDNAAPPDGIAAPPDGTVAPDPAASAVPATLTPSALTADCLCPEYCERDHANE
jgi:hypothetical protein